jgi:hypothetical protein
LAQLKLLSLNILIMALPAPEEGSLRAHNAEPDDGDADDADDADDEDHSEGDEDGAEGDDHHETYPANNQLPNIRVIDPNDDDSDDDSDEASLTPLHSVASSRPNSAASFRIHSQPDPFQSSARSQGPATQVRSTYVASRFRNHREGLRRELESFKDQKGDRLYTDSQINRQLSHSSPEGSSQKAQHDLDDSTFGKIGFISYFESRRPKFNHFRFPVSEMTINDSAFSKSERDTDSWHFRWVHLPANNFEWVYV